MNTLTKSPSALSFVHFLCCIISHWTYNGPTIAVISDKAISLDSSSNGYSVLYPVQDRLSSRSGNNIYRWALGPLAFRSEGRIVFLNNASGTIDILAL